MENEFKKSRYWQVLADAVGFLRKYYPFGSHIGDEACISAIVDDFEAIIDRYGGTPSELFVCELMQVFLCEMQREMYEG